MYIFLLYLQILTDIIKKYTNITNILFKLRFPARNGTLVYWGISQIEVY